MKKLDKLILQSFIGPFILTFLVVVFILLTQYMMKYFNDFVGKDLGFSVFAELMGYFSINMTPVAFPLAVLLSSLITFGNLGEHFELTAIKSAGISMTRILLPIFVFVVFLSLIAYLSNNYIVPKANIKAYALLYDIRQKKPSLDLKEGAFYNGIPGYSIKVNEKFPDNITLKDIIIYNHTKEGGNTDVILADSGKMYTILNDRYMMLELFDGYSYNEGDEKKVAASKSKKKNHNITNFVRNDFDKSKLVFSLSSFEMQRTKDELFAHNRMMKTIEQLRNDIDSMSFDINQTKYELFTAEDRYYNYHFERGFPMNSSLKEFIESDSAISAQYEGRLKSKNPEPELLESLAVPIEDKKKDKIEKKKSKTNSKQIPRLFSDEDLKKQKKPVKVDPQPVESLTDEELMASVNLKSDNKAGKNKVLKYAADRARYIMNNLKSNNTRIDGRASEIRVYQIEADKKYSQAVACIVLFLIGAPLGAIIKRGGLGVPVLLSITFFILYYVFTMVGEKWAKSDIIDINSGVWGANLILLPLGLFFLRQARKDARLFDSDFYAVWINKFRKRLGEKTN